MVYLKRMHQLYNIKHLVKIPLIVGIGQWDCSSAADRECGSLASDSSLGVCELKLQDVFCRLPDGQLKSLDGRTVCESPSLSQRKTRSLQSTLLILLIILRRLFMVLCL